MFFVAQVSAKQMASSKRERDFFRWLRLPLKTYEADVPVAPDARRGRCYGDTQKIALVLPSDTLQAMHDAGPKATGHINAMCSEV